MKRYRSVRLNTETSGEDELVLSEDFEAESDAENAYGDAMSMAMEQRGYGDPGMPGDEYDESGYDEPEDDDLTLDDELLQEYEADDSLEEVGVTSDADSEE